MTPIFCSLGTDHIRQASCGEVSIVTCPLQRGLAPASSCVPLTTRRQRRLLLVAPVQRLLLAHSRHDQQAAGEHPLLRARPLPLPTTVLPTEALLGRQRHWPVPPD